MKAIGIVRRIDDLGRVVVPKEIRRTLGIEEGDPLEIFVNGGQVILQKYQPETEKEDVILELQKIANDTNDPNMLETIDRAIKLIR